MNTTLQQIIFSLLLTSVLFLGHLICIRISIKSYKKKILIEIIKFYKRKEINSKRINELEKMVLRGLDDIKKDSVDNFKIIFINEHTIDVQFVYYVFWYEVHGGFRVNLNNINRDFKKHYEEEYMELQEHAKKITGRKLYFLPSRLGKKSVDFELVHDMDLDLTTPSAVEDFSSKIYGVIDLIFLYHEDISCYHDNQMVYDLGKLNNILIKLHSM